MRSCKLIVAVFAVSIVYLACALPSNADGIAFTISPLNTELSVQAGGQITGVISVVNESPSTHTVLEVTSPDDPANAHVKAYAMDWSLDADGNISFMDPSDASDSCSSWIRINPTTVSVPPGQAAEVRYTITAPANASGTYHSMIMFQQIPDTSNGHRAENAVTGRIGSAIYVNVGDTAKRARITEFHIKGRSASLTVQNTGTTILRLKGTLTLTDGAGSNYQSTAIPAVLILPGQNGLRHITINLPSALHQGESTATAVVNYGGEVLIGAKCSAASN